MARRVGLLGVLAIFLIVAGGPTWRSAAQNASPSAGAGTPPTGATIAALFDLLLAADRRPTDEAEVIVSRSTWAPGASGSTSVPDWTSVAPAGTTAGVTLDYVLAGAVVERVENGPLLVRHAAPAAVERARHQK
jgi:hypothetical protein